MIWHNSKWQGNGETCKDHSIAQAVGPKLAVLNFQVKYFGILAFGFSGVSLVCLFVGFGFVLVCVVFVVVVAFVVFLKKIYFL